MSKTFLALVMPLPDSGQKPPPCTNEDPELFFPTSESPNYAAQIREAKAVCRKCPINTRNNCLEFALETGDKWAILGGTTPSEREVMRQRRHRKAEVEARREAVRREAGLKAA